MSAATCQNCIYFHRLVGALGASAGAGECRRQAPRLRFPARHSNEEETAAWPPVAGADWCGEYRNEQLGLPFDRAVRAPEGGTV